MTPEPSDISHVIELAVAPVFLLAGIGAFTNVFAVRLGRIFDRIRHLEDALPDHEPDLQQDVVRTLNTLQRRARLAHVGIALGIVAALLVCVLIATAFFAYFFHFNMANLIGGLFILAMVALIGGLIAFLREVFIAVRSLRFGARTKS